MKVNEILQYNTYNKKIIKIKSWSSESPIDQTNLWQDFSKNKKDKVKP